MQLETNFVPKANIQWKKPFVEILAKYLQQESETCDSNAT